MWKEAEVGMELGNVASYDRIGTNKNIGWSNLSVLFVPSSCHHGGMITLIKTDHES